MAKTNQFTAEQVAQALTRANGLVSFAAQILKCSPTTVYAYIERYSTVKQAQLDARELTLDIGEASLIKAAKKGEGWAVCFLLKTLGKHRGFVEKTETDMNINGELTVKTPNVFLPQKDDSRT